MYNTQAPTGYRFKPTDEVLIQYYLIPKVEGRPLPSEHIFETGVIYGEEARDLEFTFGQAKEWYKQFASYDENFDDSLYFYTKLTKKWEKGGRISRSAGSGTWTGDKGEEIYTDQTYKVKKSYFTYTDNAAKSKGENGKGQKRKKITLTSDGNTCTWSMHEYSILIGEQALDVAIVKIRRKPSKKECSSSTSKQFQQPVGQCYVNTSYHTGAGGVDFQHLQGSSISSGNVVPVLPAAEYNHLQHQPSTSYSSTELDAAGCFQDFSFPWLFQDAMLQPSQLNFNSYSDSLYNKHLFPSVYQHQKAVPPLITDDQQEKNDLDSAVEPVAADDSKAIGGDNAAASDRNQECTNNILKTNSEVEAVQPQKESWEEYLMDSDLY